MLAGHRLVDDRDAWRFGVILRSEDATAHQADSHGAEIFRRDRIIVRARQIARRDGGPALDVEAEHVIADERHRVRQPRGLDARERFHAIEQRVSERGLLLGKRVFFLRAARAGEESRFPE